MTTIDREQEVWNRAALAAGIIDGLSGDKALSAAMLAEGMAMNGGLFHVYEALSDEELKEAISGFKYFDLREEASILEKNWPIAREMLSEEIDDTRFEVLGDQMEQDWERFNELTGIQDTLNNVFKKHFVSNPSEYAPV